MVPKAPHALILQLFGCAVFGLPKLARFVRWKESVRKVSPARSVTFQRLCRDASSCAVPGPYPRFPAAFPKEPGGGLFECCNVEVLVEHRTPRPIAAENRAPQPVWTLGGGEGIARIRLLHDAPGRSGLEHHVCPESPAA